MSFANEAVIEHNKNSADAMGDWRAYIASPFKNIYGTNKYNGT